MSKISCNECKYYEYSNHSDWAHDIIFHICRHPSKRLKYDDDCKHNRNKNGNCKWFKVGKPVNEINSEEEIKRRIRNEECRMNANLLMSYGYIPSNNPIIRFFQRIFN